MPQLTMTDVTKKVLANGITVIVDRGVHFRAVSIVLCLIGGSRDEQLQTLGLTHLLEHLLLKRTKRRSTLELAEYMDELGGTVNAYTDTESLCIFGTVSQNDWRKLLTLFSELLLEPDFREEDLSLEKLIIRQEILESEDDPSEVVGEEFAKQLWPESMLGLPVFGTTDTVDQCSLDAVRARCLELIAGERIVIVASGNVSADEVATEVENIFTHLPTAPRPTSLPPKVGHGVHLVPVSVSQVYIALGCPWPGMQHSDYLAGLIISNVLGGTMSSRLFQELREKRGLAYSIYSDVEAYPDIGALVIGACVERTTLQATLAAMSEQVGLLRETQITGEELRRTKQMMLAQMLMNMDDGEGRMWRALRSELNFGRYVSVDEVSEKLTRISLDDIRTLATRSLECGKFLLIVGGELDGLEVTGEIRKLCE